MSATTCRDTVLILWINAKKQTQIKCFWYWIFIVREFDGWMVPFAAVVETFSDDLSVMSFLLLLSISFGLHRIIFNVLSLPRNYLPPMRYQWSLSWLGVDCNLNLTKIQYLFCFQGSRKQLLLMEYEQISKNGRWSSFFGPCLRCFNCLFNFELPAFLLKVHKLFCVFWARLAAYNTFAIVNKLLRSHQLLIDYSSITNWQLALLLYPNSIGIYQWGSLWDLFSNQKNKSNFEHSFLKYL